MTLVSRLNTAGIRGHFKHRQNDFTLDATFSLPETGITGIFGHSGSGKTTLLRCIAGLDKAAQGELTVSGKDWQTKDHFVPTHKRPIGFVFQEASLFAHLTAHGNLRYAMKRAAPGTPPISFDHAIHLLGISHLLDRHPHQLSGGEKQRVAIARALLINPQLLLMDEPLASLDMARKQEILPYLEQLKAELNIPILYVSHSTDEIVRLADHLLVLKQGNIVASGALDEVLSRLDFPVQLGEDMGSVIKGTITEIDSQWHLMKVVFGQGPSGEGALWLRESTGVSAGVNSENSSNDNAKAVSLEKQSSQVRVRVLARDISLTLNKHDDSSILNIIEATVSEIVDDTSPGLSLVKLNIHGTSLIAKVTHRSVHQLLLAPGKPVWAQIKSAALVR